MRSSPADLPCPKCKEPVAPEERLCPSCGSGIATLRVEVSARGRPAETVTQRVAVAPDQVEEFEILEATEFQHGKEYAGPRN